MEQLPVRLKDANANVEPLQDNQFDDAFRDVSAPKDARGEGPAREARQASEASDHSSILGPALTKNQRAGRRRGERRKSRRKKKFEGRLDAYAKALNTTKEDPRVMAAIDAEDKKLSQGANRLANPPKSGSTKTKFFHDETLLANREYYQNDLAVLADPAKNQRRIDQLQEHFNAVGNWSIWSDGKAVVREDLKAEELKARRDWRNRALPEHIAAETIKKIAFGLRVVRGNMLRGLGLWSAPAAEIHNKLVEMYAAYNQT